MNVKAILGAVAVVTAIGGLIYAKYRQQKFYEQLAVDTVMNNPAAFAAAAASAAVHEAANELRASNVAGEAADAILDESMAKLRAKANEHNPTLQ